MEDDIYKLRDRSQCHYAHNSFLKTEKGLRDIKNVLISKVQQYNLLLHSVISRETKVTPNNKVTK